MDEFRDVLKHAKKKKEVKPQIPGSGLEVD